MWTNRLGAVGNYIVWTDQPQAGNPKEIIITRPGANIPKTVRMKSVRRAHFGIRPGPSPLAPNKGPFMNLDRSAAQLDKLTEEEAHVIVDKGTQRPFTGEYTDLEVAGAFIYRR